MKASDSAYERLRGEIVDWRLEPGTVLAEVELSQRLGLSRTPVREALSRLTADGLAQPTGGRGLIVSPVSVDDVRDLFELRTALERQAAQHAARHRRVDDFVAVREALERTPAILSRGDDGLTDYFAVVARFDAAIDGAVGNGYLRAALAGVRTHAARIRRLSHDDPRRLLDAAKEHLLIVDAIIDGDATLAADATSVHLAASLRWILSSLSSSPSPLLTTNGPS